MSTPAIEKNASAQSGQPSASVSGCGASKANSGPIKGFLSAPTPDQLAPTPRERHLLSVLWDWQQQSAKSQTVWDKHHNGAHKPSGDNP